MKMRAWMAIPVGMLALGLGLLAAPLREAGAEQRGDESRLVGLSMPSHLAAIAAEQSGTIVEMGVQDGARVAKRGVLFRLSSELEQLEVNRLQALVDSQLEREKAAANLEHAKKKAARIRQLSDKEISAESTVLEVELESELARLSLGKADFEQKQLRNELLQAQQRLENRTLRSPLDGVVTRHFKQLGETADQLEPVVEVMSLDPLWVQFECPVSRENAFPLGSKVLVKPVIGAHAPRVAEVVHVSLQAAVAGHTFSIRVSLANPNYDWRSGLKMSIEPIPDPAAKPGGGK